MQNFIKKNWFVCLLAICFAVISTFYIYDTNKGKLKGKTSGGESVVYEINGKDVTVSQFYDDMFETAGNSALYHALTRAVTNSIETTEDMETTAASQASQIVANYSQSYSTSYREEIGAELQTLGYSGYEELELYLVDSQKVTVLTTDYAKNHFEDLKARAISYILIMPSTTVTNEDGTSETITRTDEEIEALKEEISEKLANGTSFYDLAVEYSDDSTSAPTGGYLGVIDVNTTNLDETFFNTSMDLDEGEVSEWVHSDQFGEFLILNNASTAESFEEFYIESNTTDDTTTVDVTDAYIEFIQSYDTTLANKAIYEAAEVLGLSFSDESHEAALKTYMEIGE